MATSVQDMMLDSLLKASRAAEQITTNVDRAKAFTELANACAMALQTKVTDDIPTVEALKEAPKTAVKKGTKKAAEKVAQSAEEQQTVEETKVVEEMPQPVVKEAKEEPEPEPVKGEQTSAEPAKEESVQSTNPLEDLISDEDLELTDSWTPKALEVLAKEVSIFQGYINKFGDDTEIMMTLIRDATNGQVSSVRGVNPMNIRMVIAYIQQLEQKGQ